MKTLTELTYDHWELYVTACDLQGVNPNNSDYILWLEEQELADVPE